MTDSLARIDQARQMLDLAVTLDDIKAVRDMATAAETYARAAKLGLQAQNSAATIKVRAERKAGELLRELERKPGERTDATSSDVVTGSPYRATLDAAAITYQEAHRWQTLATIPEDELEATIAETTAEGRELTTHALVTHATRENKRAEVMDTLASISAREVKAAAGVYDVLVIDPPWPMQKVERDVRPNQVALEYPTMNEAELAALEIPAADDCHVWLWTTHKFLPMALRLLDAWQLKYVCTFVWHKPGGPQPFELPQYNCEFAIYARRGTPIFTETKAFPVCFEASRTGHSAKPEAFYDVIRRVTAGRRLDMFNRRSIEGFDGWGNEAAS